MTIRWSSWTIAVLFLLFGAKKLMAALTPELQPTFSGLAYLAALLSFAVLVFGLIILGLEILVVLKSSKAWDIHSVRLLGLTLSIVAGLFLVTAGYSQEQIAPLIGLLGTIVGYLLGQTESRRGVSTRE